MKTTTKGFVFLAIVAVLGWMPIGSIAAMSSAPSQDDPTDLGAYFGFEPLEVIRVDRGVGPVIVADMNGDGLLDIVAANNFKSRIEIHQQRADASPEDALDVQDTHRRVNDLPEHWRYQRDVHSVIHRVSAILAYDYDEDGLTDLIFASSQPAEIVFMRQIEPGEFQVDRRHRVRNLNAGRKSFTLADLTGNGRNELIALVRGEIQIWTIDGVSLTPLTKRAADEPIGWFEIEDFNGDGRLDIAAAIPNHSSPIRLWLGIGQSGAAGDGETGSNRIGPELRFELPALRDMKAVRLPGERAARLGVVERASKRLVLYELDTEPIPEEGVREAALRVYSFTDPGNRRRPVAIVDANGDGRLDVIAADGTSNSIAVFRQRSGHGLEPPQSYPGLSDVTQMVAIADADRPDGNSADGAYVFVLSEEEGVVGRSRINDETVTFPTPLPIPDGYTPVAMNLVRLTTDDAATGEGRPHLAVIVKESRNYMVVVMTLEGRERYRVDLGSHARAPETIIAVDADQDGLTDLLLFTPDRPMTMLHATGEGFTHVESRDMGQFGLVQAARAENTAVTDIDGNGFAELLIADRNYVRAVRYHPAPTPEGESDDTSDEPGATVPGWHVVTQINASDESARLMSLTTFDGRGGDRIIAADTENNRLVMFAPVSDVARQGGTAAPVSTAADAAVSSQRNPQQWQQAEAIQLTGFSPTALHGGAFSGNGRQDILAIGDSGFTVIQLGGERYIVREFASWVGDDERQFPHELLSGDVNGDGLVDLVMLEAGEQLCHIFTFSEKHELHFALRFKVFESRIFTSGEPREFEPRYGLVADVTGNGADDLVLICHDRLLLYPQMTPPEE